MASKWVSSVSTREVQSLYREVLRTCRAFHHVDDKGRPWNALLKQNARSEFEAGRAETDPLVIARMLVVGRESVQQIQMKFNQADKAIEDRIKRDVSRR
ncbi:hypothetical protein TL16_g08021 [Triparma laevis f. inornata]|uniref:Complex 1 LYR protein domain-containing protein n=2 Tax=Triparma laevis TaxID=1534972 RepID=A0A9W7L0N6_9STRA|nr:hypothetical protein TL16_g08021 [Triparma laevis f. inornata]GMI18244.1 hypothetical protein TrLO_g7052 [Triparma laevis f. longispina]